MNKKQKLAETRRRIVALEGRLRSMRENRAPRTGLAYLIESELEKAEIVLAAKGIIDKIGKMAEDLAKVNGDDIMPMMDSLKAAFGPDMAGNFQGIAQEKLNAATIALTQIKDAISSEVSKLEGVVNGGATNDMATDMGAAPPAPAMGDAPIGNVGGAAPAPDGGAPVPQGDEGVGADMSSDDAAGDSQLDGAFQTDTSNGPSTGRAKKESAQPRGNPVREGKTADRIDADRKKAGAKPMSKGSRDVNDFLDGDDKPKKKGVKEGEFIPGKKGVNPFAKKDDEKKDDSKADKKDESDKDEKKLNESKKHKKKGHYVCSKVRGGYGVVSGPYGGCSAASGKKGDGQCVLSHDGEGNWCHAEGGKSGSSATVVDSAGAGSTGTAGGGSGASGVSENARGRKLDEISRERVKDYKSRAYADAQSALDSRNGSKTDMRLSKRLHGMEDANDKLSGKAKVKATESAGARALAASSNPDALIFDSFRKQIREGRSPITAARAVASVFAVDFADVVDIIREGRSGK